MGAVGTAERSTGACRPVVLAAPPTNLARAASRCGPDPSPTTRGRPVAEARDFAEFYAASFHGLTVQLYAHTGDLGLDNDPPLVFDYIDTWLPRLAGRHRRTKAMHFLAYALKIRADLPEPFLNFTPRH